MDTELDEHLD